MSELLNMLSGGDLRSDGRANEVAAAVLETPELFSALFAGLKAPDEVIRGRTADALEKVARARPDLLVGPLQELVEAATSDRLPMVRWHVAMILGHLAGDEEIVEQVVLALLTFLEDDSVFVRSWAIVSLCIAGRNHPVWKEQILARVVRCQADDSTAVRSKVRTAVSLLSDETAPFPKGWIKSTRMSAL